MMALLQTALVLAQALALHVKAQSSDLLFPAIRDPRLKHSTIFRVRCQPLVSARLDPIVNPGEMSGHVHDVFGNFAFAKRVGIDKLATGARTTCDIVEDASLYWFPALYLKLPGGMLRRIRSIGQPYYHSIGIDNRNPDTRLHAFPKNFRVIAGSSTLRGGSRKPVVVTHTKTVWFCEKRAGRKRSALRYETFPPIDDDCEFLRSNVYFPSCWNGVSLDSRTHKQHVAFSDEKGRCPRTHPILFPVLKLESLFFFRDLGPQFTSSYRRENFVLSNGDATGASMHADFLSGWDPNFLVRQLSQCRELRGANADCPHTTQRVAGSTFDNVRQRGRAVKVLGEMPDEEVDLVAILPGSM